MLTAIARALIVWLATLVVIWLPMRGHADGALVPMLLGFFFTIPAMVALVLLHGVETTMFRSTLPIMGLSLGVVLFTIGWCLPASALAEVTWATAAPWLLTGIVRAAFYRPVPSWP